MPTTHVLARHDDGRWHLAELLHQHRTSGRWRAVVRYTVAAGMTYVRGEWCDQLRPAPEQQHDQQHGDGRGHGDADGQDQPAGQVAWVLPHGREA